MLAKHALSQLSYGPEIRLRAKSKLVGLGRLELPTSRLSSARSNQLSYKPKPIARPGLLALEPINQSIEASSRRAAGRLVL